MVDDHPEIERRTYRVTEPRQKEALGELPERLPGLGLGCAYNKRDGLLAIICESSSIGLFGEIFQAIGIQDVDPQLVPEF